jgi:type IV pilus assembly protein PilO
MISLQNQIRWCTRAQIALGGLLLVMGSGFYFFGYRPAQKNLTRLSNETATMQGELLDNTRRSQILPAVALEVKNLRLRLDGSKKMPRDMDIAGFINDLTHISQATQIGKPQYRPDAPKRGDLFSQYPIELQLQGNFTNVFSFIRETESLPRLTRVRSIDIKADPAKPGFVGVDLGMDLYFSPDQ